MMSFRSFARFFCLAAVALGINVPASAGVSLYTTYTFNGPNTIDLATCGTTYTSQGCYPGASLTDLSGACSILEGPPATSGNTTTQKLYVLQTGSSAAPAVTLKIYNKSITAQPIMIGPTPSTRVTTTASLLRAVNVKSLKGGPGLTCYMAANATSIFLGTSKSTNAMQVDKRNYVQLPFGQGVPPSPVAGITADEEGYVIVFFGADNPSFYLFGPDGRNLEFGGAANPIFIPNQTNGVRLN